MAEVRIQIPDEVVKQIQEKVGDVKLTDIAKDAFTIYNWAVEERSKGRVVLSSDEEGERMVRLAMASLDQAATKAKSGQR
ncbi:MAG TPA: hypothetical protein VG759_19665 [Candidatus Angelobacter sp.]|jgi:hypothetical protein|nr:hypothetical protein [Candidatus Angelobacter sp.]